MPALHVRHRDGSAATVPLTTQPIRLGRAETCAVVLRNDSEVSREHAEIWIDEEGQVVVADLGSKNGTRVDDGELFRNEARVARRVIRLGDHLIDVLGVAPPEAAAVRFLPDAPSRAGDTKFFPSSKRLDLNQQRLGLLMSLTQRIGGVFERKQLLEHALDVVCEALGFERGLIVVRTQRGDVESPVTRNVGVDETGAYKVSRTLINRALLHGERAVVNNPATDLAGDLSQSLLRFPICSALCVPVLHRDEILGVIYGDRVTQASTYAPEDVDFLAAIAQQVGVGLTNLRLLQEYTRSREMYAELTRAREIQQRLLPSAPLVAGRVRIEGYNEPSSAVSGDYYDYFLFDERRAGFIIADVTGHGLPAALLMANLQAAVHVALTRHIELPDIAARINRLICRNTSTHVFITAIFGTIDAETGQIEFVSAGHPGPVLLGGERTGFSFEENALPLGLDPDDEFRVQRIAPGKGEAAVLFYTDGLVEAMNPNGDPLGLPAVEAAMQRIDARTPPALVREARNVLRAHLAGEPSTDDMTLLAIHFQP